MQTETELLPSSPSSLLMAPMPTQLQQGKTVLALAGKYFLKEEEGEMGEDVTVCIVPGVLKSFSLPD